MPEREREQDERERETVSGAKRKRSAYGGGPRRWVATTHGTSHQEGKIPELMEELNSQYKDKRKDAVKKVITAMTVGKDVSSLFKDVVNCMQTENLELKKLVYLYLKSQPDLAILAVNTFVKDSQDPNPPIRTLAVRTMGCIRVDKITEYLCDPLQRCLKDDDPIYVKMEKLEIMIKLASDRNIDQVPRCPNSWFTVWN